MDEILRYFPDLTPEQRRQCEVMLELYPRWNDKINVVSRRDIEHLALHHIVHSLAIARFFTPVPGTEFVDLGTGGGFPAIPLAMYWPECRFHLVDRIAKKLRVAEDVAREAGLQNVSLQHGDAGECRRKFDYVVSRAVMPLPDLIRASRHMKAAGQRPGNRLPNGLICLKGGDLDAEIAASGCAQSVLAVPITDWFADEYFANKYLIYCPL